jgi:hypothetical protein
MKSMIRPAVCLIGLLSAISGSAFADIITVNFSGAVTSLDDSNDALGGAVGVGDPYSATLTYDTATPGSPFFTETLFEANSGNGYDFNFKATVDGITFQSSSTYYGQMPVSDTEYQWDELEPTIPSAVSDPSQFNGTNLIELDLNGSGTHTQTLPTSLNLADYTYQLFEISLSSNLSGDSTALFGSVTSLSAIDSTAPEPATFLLVGCGLIAAGLSKRARSPRK